MKFQSITMLGGMGLALLASGLAGCSILPQKGWGTPPPGAPPMVTDCSVVTISTPTRYACNGKVYTSFDLEKQRLAWETAQNSETHPGTVPTKY
jgi:aspartate aminotransferase-like enzyme